MNEFNVPEHEYLFSLIHWQWCTCGCETFTPTDKASVQAFRVYTAYCQDHGLVAWRPKLPA
jgi:hypothetical protein